MINSLLGQDTAPVGVNRHVTIKINSYVDGNKIYLDTPALIGDSYEQIAEKFENILKKNTKCKIFFIVTLEAGRVYNDDIDKINRFMHRLRVNNIQYNIIVNKVCQEEKDFLLEQDNKNIVLNRYNSDTYKTNSIFFVDLDIDILSRKKKNIEISQELYNFFYKTTLYIHPFEQQEERDYIIKQQKIMDLLGELRRSKNHSLSAEIEKLIITFYQSKAQNNSKSDENLEYKINACLSQIYQFIKNDQISMEANESFGAWPSLVTAEKIADIKLEDPNVFMTLQTALSLLRTSEKFPNFNVHEINERVSALAEKYIEDTLTSDRKEGSVCFWRYLKLQDDKFTHNLSAEALHLFDGLDLFNDLDTSSRLALFLSYTNRRHAFIEDFVKTCVENISEKKNGFNSWVSNKLAILETSDVDPVVNLNILAAFSRYEKTFALSNEQKQALLKTYNEINSRINENRIFSSSNYYDRPSEIFFSYALALKEDAIGLLPSLEAMQKLIYKEATLAYLDETTSPTEIAEFMLSLYYVGIAANNENSVNEILHLLLEKLIKIIWDDKKGFIITSNSVYIGNFSTDKFHWQSQSYSSALILEALTLYSLTNIN